VHQTPLRSSLVSYLTAPGLDPEFALLGPGIPFSQLIFFLGTLFFPNPSPVVLLSSVGLCPFHWAVDPRFPEVLPLPRGDQRVIVEKSLTRLPVLSVGWGGGGEPGAGLFSALIRPLSFVLFFQLFHSPRRDLPVLRVSRCSWTRPLG